MALGDIGAISKVDRFSNMILPLLWTETVRFCLKSLKIWLIFFFLSAEVVLASRKFVEPFQALLEGVAGRRGECRLHFLRFWRFVRAVRRIQVREDEPEVGRGILGRGGVRFEGQLLFDGETFGHEFEGAGSLPQQSGDAHQPRTVLRGVPQVEGGRHFGLTSAVAILFRVSSRDFYRSSVVL